MTDPRLEAVLERIDSALALPDDRRRELYVWLRYQMGWADQDGRRVSARTAKGVRPLLCVIACQALGGQAASAVPAAAAIELTHEFSLIHDDIEDDDRTRRGRPALWTITGIGQGINAGDALYGIARSQLSDSPVAPEVLVEMQRTYDRACINLAEGQYLDLSYESEDDTSVDDYLMMVSRKTGALIAAAAALGALAGGAPMSDVEAMHRYGLALGVAFQIQDDVLGLWGDPERTGKPVGSDLMRRKKSLPVLLAMDDETLAPEVASLYASAEVAQSDALALVTQMERRGVRERCVQLARGHAETAYSALDGLVLAAVPREELAGFVSKVVERDR